MPEGHVGLDNVLFAPLVIEGKTVGLLGLANKPGGFTENDLKIASAFGGIAALTLQNSRTLELLEDSEERFRSVMQTATDAVITVNKAGNVLFWNRAAEKIFGYPSKKIIGKPLAMIIPERFREAHENGLQRFISAKQPKVVGKTVELVGLKADGNEFPLELSLASWQTKGEIFFTGIVRDISDRKYAEEKIKFLAKFPEENPNPVLRVK